MDPAGADLQRAGEPWARHRVGTAGGAPGEPGVGRRPGGEAPRPAGRVGLVDGARRAPVPPAGAPRGPPAGPGARTTGPRRIADRDAGRRAAFWRVHLLTRQLLCVLVFVLCLFFVW